MAIADRIVVMNEGRIEDAGPPRQVYASPRSLFSAAFMGEVNLIPLDGNASALGVLPLGNLGRRTLCIRPQAFGDHGLHLGRARVTEVTFFGAYVRVRAEPLAAPDLPLVVHLPPHAGPQAGEVIDLHATAHVVLEG